MQLIVLPGDPLKVVASPQGGNCGQMAPPETQCPIRSFSKAVAMLIVATDIGVKNRALESPFPLLPDDGP